MLWYSLEEPCYHESHGYHMLLFFFLHFFFLFFFAGFFFSGDMRKLKMSKLFGCKNICIFEFRFKITVNYLSVTWMWALS